MRWRKWLSNLEENHVIFRAVNKKDRREQLFYFKAVNFLGKAITRILAEVFDIPGVV